jgi:pteridine reductase
MKTVLVTGAARRIGREIAKHFQANNYNVIIHYNTSQSEAKELSDSLNDLRLNSAQIIQADLGQLVDPSFSQDFKQQVLGYYNKIDVLVNNASSFFATHIGEVTIDMWRDLMISNAGGPFFLSQLLAPSLKATQGSIVNISDIHATKPLKDYSVYSMAKAANNMLTKSLARELAPYVRVNAVAPGPIIWPEHTNELSQGLKSKILDKTLLKKLGEPLDIAKAVYFLAESNYITGQILAVDGGRSIKD